MTERNSSERISDDETWHLATLSVALAALRAATLGREDVEAACSKYIETMHKLVGTAPPPAWRRPQ